MTPDRMSTPPPSWRDISERLRLREPHPFQISESPYVLALVEPMDRSVALVADGWPNGASTTIRPARGIRIQPHGPGGRAAVWIDDPDLLELGWQFLSAVAERLILGEALINALDTELERWRDLVSGLSATSVTAAIGALGELAVMQAALLQGQTSGSWVGLDGGAIDFRFGTIECEVKTTVAGRHEHIINGADQLRPSVDRRLFVLSLIVSTTQSGSGTSVVRLVSELANLGVSRDRLVRSLKRHRQLAMDDPAAQVGYVLRGGPLVIEVDDDFPALTSSVIESALGSDASRIRDLTYRLDLEGLRTATDPFLTAVAAGVRL